MSLISAQFLLFLCCSMIVYYVLPKRYQWMMLLGISYLFYAVAGIKTIGFIMITTLTTWLGALHLNKISDTRQIVLNSQKEQMTQAEQKAFKAATKQKRRILFWLVIVFNFGILAVLKYSNFVLMNISSLVASVTNEMATFIPLHLLLPLGISFYTFQSMGYLIDVYNNKYKADTNLAKFSLFVSFFPQIIQGPIGRHDQLAGQFYTPKSFDWNKFEQAALLMLWGYFKKMVIADTAVILVNQVFDNAYSYSGTTIVVAVLFYSIQQYADFSGGIDIVTGAAQLFGIQLAPNFRRPYFSTSLGEFWRRWHISLGAWMRDYIFYPLALTKPMNKIAKLGKKHFGKTAGRVIPVALANIVVFFLVGLWHGAEWHYIIWGLYNGFVLAFSAAAAPLYTSLKKVFRINEKSAWWKAFQILRTFLVVNIGWFFDRGVNLSASFNMLGRAVFNFKIMNIFNGSMVGLGISGTQLFIFMLSVVSLLFVSVTQEKGMQVKNIFLKYGLFFFFVLAIIWRMAQTSNMTEAFMYAQF